MYKIDFINGFISLKEICNLINKIDNKFNTIILQYINSMNFFLFTSEECNIHDLNQILDLFIQSKLQIRKISKIPSSHLLNKIRTCYLK